ncbi:MAG: Rrf2 family transcriptional regulator [Desulfobacterota bacterium]|nr:Rrf2 family transcriptional regulator [Thermodesulfobacteriota bacterium]
MRLSTKGRYGTRAMIDIAMHSAQGPTLMKDIAARQDIAPKYLDHILSALRKAGLLKNIRGRGGGYVLARPAANITLREIIEAVEGKISPVECLDNPSQCDRVAACPTRPVWARLRQAMLDVLGTTTLDMLTEHHVQHAGQQTIYCI